MTRLYTAGAVAVAAAGSRCAVGAGLGVHQRAVQSISAGTEWRGAGVAQWVAPDVAWRGPVSQLCSSVLGVQAADAAVAAGADMAWLSAVPVAVDGQLGVASVSAVVVAGAGISLHQAAAQRSDVMATMLGTDLYTIRPSEYDLRQSELLTGVSGDINLTAGEYVPSPVVRVASFDLTRLPAYPISTAAVARVYQPPPQSGGTRAVWGDGESLHYSPDLPYIVEPPLIPGAPVLEPNAREVHILMNQVDVISLPDETPLSVSDIRMSLDRDSFSWRLSCDVLNAASVALLKPDVSGNKELAVVVNGHRWEFFVASWGDSRAVDGNKLNKRFAVTGYSRSQYLALPYAPKRTRSISSTTAVQAATDELTGTGFALNWNTADLPDWSMPGATFSYQELAPLQVIKRLADAVGAIVQPSLAADELTVRPRYWPVPWALAGSVMDKTIHESQIFSEGGQYEYRDTINSVFVSGETAGVGATIVRQGTAGDLPGQDIVEPWLTAQAANVSRGRQELAGSGPCLNHTLELAIPEGSAEPGLLLPGQTVAVVYDDDSLSYRGYVTSVNVSIPGRGLAKVRQTVTIEQPLGWED